MLKSIVITLCTFTTMFCSQAQATKYQITEISQAYDIKILDINDNGIVLGSYFPDYYGVYNVYNPVQVGFIWEPDQKITEFGISSVSDFHVYGINNVNNVIFTLYDATYMWNKDIGYWLRSIELGGISLNDDDTFVGFTHWNDEDEHDISVTNSEDERIYLVDGKKIKPISTDHKIYPKSINEKNILVNISNSAHSWALWDFIGKRIKGATVEDSFYPKCEDVYGRGLNNLNDVIGVEEYDDITIGVLWPFKGTKTLIAFPLSEDVDETHMYPKDINDLQQVVGYVSEDKHKQAFIWSPKQDSITYLNDCISPNSNWDLTEASAINNKGQIVGTGWHNDCKAAFVLTPIPE